MATPEQLAMFPNTPGFKEQGGTSEEAAKKVAGWRDRLYIAILAALGRAEAGMGGLTADECAAMIDSTPGAVRPRFTELKLLGQVEKTGKRRKNSSGMSATVWRRVAKKK